MAKTVKKTSTSKLSTTKVKNSGKLAWFKRLGRMQQRSLVVLLVALVGVGGFLTYRSFAATGITLSTATYTVDSFVGNGYTKQLDLVQTLDKTSEKRKAYVAKVSPGGNVGIKILPSKLATDIKNNMGRKVNVTYRYKMKIPLAGVKYSLKSPVGLDRTEKTQSPIVSDFYSYYAAAEQVSTNSIVEYRTQLAAPVVKVFGTAVYVDSISVSWAFQD